MDDFELFPFVDGKGLSFKTPPQVSFEKYLEHMDLIPTETAMMYGLHTNFEIGLGSQQCVDMFDMLTDIMPKEESADTSSDGMKVRNDEMYISKILGDINIKEKMFSLVDIKDKINERGPYQNVFLQECEYMNYLLEEINRSLVELEQGIKGILTISEQMENLQNSLNLERLPDQWNKLCYPTKRSMATWLENLLKRVEQLSAWKDDPMSIPRITRINYLFNPKSFLTSINQFGKKAELNKLYISTEFTKKNIDEIDAHAKDGAYAYGFLLEGARWSTQINQIEEAKPKEMFSVMPVVLLRSLPIKAEVLQEDKTIYQCPVYRTENRGREGYIFTAQLKTSTKNPPRKWVIGGVSCILDVEGVSDETKKSDDKK